MMPLDINTKVNPHSPKAPPAFSRAFGLRFGVPTLAVAAACLSTRLLQEGMGQKSPSSVFFLIAVIVSTSIGDLYVGICATLLSVACYDYFFLPPFHSFTIYRSDAPTLLLFVLVALLINGVGGRLQARTRAADRRSQDLVQELTVVKDELAALNSITSAVSVSLEMRVVLERLQQQLMSRLNIACGAIFVANEEHSHLSLKASWGLPGTFAREWAELPVDSFEHQPGAWKFGSLEGTAISLIANEELQGALYIGGRQAGEGDGYGPAFWIALGRQIGVVVENARLYAEVCAGRERLQLLSRRLVQVQEAERRQIARELHDEIGQTLTGLKLNLEMSARQSPPNSQANLTDALALINELITHARDLSLHLRPAMLDDLGLLPTLLWHFGRYSALTGVKVCCEHTGVEQRFPVEVETAAYRIAQEGLTNVARHAHIGEVTVRLWATRSLLGVQIVDRGCGFDAPRIRGSFGTGGLLGMEERATLLGGRLTIESTTAPAPETGTCITAELPLGKHPHE